MSFSFTDLNGSLLPKTKGSGAHLLGVVASLPFVFFQDGNAGTRMRVCVWGAATKTGDYGLSRLK